MKRILWLMLFHWFVLIANLFSQNISAYYGFQTHFGQFNRADMDSASMEAMLDRVQAAGFKMIRDECYWSEVEKTRGVFEFPRQIDNYIQAAKRRGIDVLLILDYNNPLYAPHAGAAVTTDSNRAAFARYSQETVKRYVPLGVLHYEIWNEPNIPIFWDPTPNPGDYAKLLQIAYPAIKAIDPRVTVIGCATSPAEGNPAPFIDWLTFINGVFQNGGGNFMDAVSFHSYHVDQRPEVNFFRDIQKLQAIVGMERPLWLTEIGYPTNLGWPNISLETQANYAARLFLLGKAVPQLKLISYYDLKNDGQDAGNAEHNFGVLQYNLQPKPAYLALKNLATFIADKPLVKSTLVIDRYVYEFAADQNWVIAAWKTSGQADQPIKIRAPFCRLLNRDGGVLNDFVTADSSVVIAIAESPCYLVSLASTPVLRQFDLEPNRAILYPQQKFDIRANGRDTAGVAIQFQLAALNWCYLGTGGRIDSLGQFQAEAPGSGLLIGSYGTFADTVVIDIVQPGTHIIEEFDSVARWNLSSLNLDSLNTRLSVSDAVFSSGNHSARIDYQFTYRSNISSSNYRIYLNTDLVLPGDPDSLLIDFYGNGQPHKLRFQFHDAFGETFVRSISTALNWNDEWRTAKLALKNFPGQVDYPLWLTQITIFVGQENPQNDATYQGTMYLDRLRTRSNRATLVPEATPETPRSFRLDQNYPNPFNSATTICYYLTHPQKISLKLYNLSGQELIRLVDEFQTAGEYQVQLSADDLPSGIYFYRLEAGKMMMVRKMVVLR